MSMALVPWVLWAVVLMPQAVRLPLILVVAALAMMVKEMDMSLVLPAVSLALALLFQVSLTSGRLR